MDSGSSGEGLKAAAARVLGEGAGDSPAPAPSGRKRGRPKGSVSRPRPAEEPERVYVPNEQNIRGSAILGATLWKIAGGMLGYRSLTVEEGMELGRALDPVLFKYVPLLSDWQAEINLLVVLAGLAAATRIKKEAGGDDEAQPLHDNNGQRRIERKSGDRSA